MKLLPKYYLRSHRRQTGISLLEVLLALAILGMSLMMILTTISRNVRALYHARLLSSATFLCRKKLTDWEQKWVRDGFELTSGSIQENGTFDTEGLPVVYKWSLKVDSLTFSPQNTKDKIEQGMDKASAGANFAAAGQLTTMLQQLTDLFERGTRKVTVTVNWDEPGKPNQSITVSAIYTDSRVVGL